MAGDAESKTQAVDTVPVRDEEGLREIHRDIAKQQAEAKELEDLVLVRLSRSLFLDREFS